MYNDFRACINNIKVVELFLSVIRKGRQVIIVNTFCVSTDFKLSLKIHNYVVYYTPATILYWLYFILHSFDTRGEFMSSVKNKRII